MKEGKWKGEQRTQQIHNIYQHQGAAVLQSLQARKTPTSISKGAVNYHHTIGLKDMTIRIALRKSASLRSGSRTAGKIFTVTRLKCPWRKVNL